ncbi:hypothetical protein CK203_039103 [Vitis vinifera]|uniref:Uncharacterized protein n=1 Tax=Vitis vinifera TaxID=29760 RepID=A0A438IFP5_VITVI|nr:hypothetical protein CK203_039103 [Vitis vinifera]
MEALFRISEGYFFGPHHLIMAALLYFEEKVHWEKLLRADAIPLLFPTLLCQILEHLGYPAEPQLERKRICQEIFTLDRWTSMTTYGADQGAPTGPEHLEHPEEPVEIPVDTPPPAPTVASTEHILRIAIPIIEYKGLCHTFQALATSRASSLANDTLVLIRSRLSPLRPTHHPEADSASLGIISVLEHAIPSPPEPSQALLSYIRLCLLRSLLQERQGS